MPNDIQQNIAFGVSVVQDIIAAGYDFLNNEEPRKDVVREATEQYVKGLFERFGEVKVLGMNRPVPLLSLYVRANILEKIRSRASARIEEMEQFFNQDRHSFGKKTGTKDGEEIANRLKKFIVLGKPGAGKTTFLKFLTISILSKHSRIKNRRLPIFITLRDWADRRCDLMDYIAKQFDICGFEQAESFVERALKLGNCLVLFDGLDEVSQEANLDGIIREIRDFTDKYTENQFVMSCRIAAYNHWFERFTDVEMADFNDEQIEGFVKNWFADESKMAEECMAHLKSSPQLRELSSVPLLLTLLCLTYYENNDFPANRAELYEEAIDALLRKWDSSRRIRRDDPYKQLSLKQKENMFVRIAYGTFTENRYFIREQELTKMISNYIGNLPAFKTESLEVDSLEVLHSIESNHGIFVERAKHIHSFAHLTFQEYFTAKYIVDNTLNMSLDSLKKYLYDNKWKEVFLLVAGMLHDADEFLLMILKTNRERLKDVQLNYLLNRVSTTLNLHKSKYSMEIRKSFAIYFILAQAHDRSIDRRHGVSRSLDRTHVPMHILDAELTIALDCEHNLANARIFARNLVLSFDGQGDPALVRNLDRDLSKGLIPGFERDLAFDFIRDFEPDLALDSVQGFVRTISSYLSANILIIQCLNSAAYLSKSTREYVLSMLLAPLTEEERGRWG